MKKRPEQHRDESTVKQLFASVATRYDLLNTLLSFNLDTYWRRRAAFHSGLKPGQLAIDFCCGTGNLTLDLARKIAPDGSIVGVDFSPAMLARAQAKLHGSPYQHNVQYLEANVLHLPFSDHRFDCASISFGLRNVSDIGQTLKEMIRVAKPGGTILILELCRPKLPLLRQFYNLYLDFWLPLIGNFGRRKQPLYHMVPASLKTLPEPEEICSLMRQLGLSSVRCRRLSLGTAALYTGYKDPQAFSTFCTAT